MGRITSFKDEFTFDERVKESSDIIAKYPDRVPGKFIPHLMLSMEDGLLASQVEQVIAERFSSSDLPQMEKKKYLVPRDMSIGQFIHILSGRLRLTPGKALFVFVNETLPQTATLMTSVYESSKDKDGFLYMCYSSEKTFG